MEEPFARRENHLNGIARAASAATGLYMAFDCESDGLFGPILAVGARVVAGDGRDFGLFYARHEATATNPWVLEHVIPALDPPRHKTYEGVLAAFRDFVKLYPKIAGFIGHMPYIVEARLMRDLVESGVWPDVASTIYPLHDVAGLLVAVGEDPTEQDAACKRRDIYVGRAHHPTIDANASVRLWLALRREIEAERAKAKKSAVALETLLFDMEETV